MSTSTERKSAAREPVYEIRTCAWAECSQAFRVNSADGRKRNARFHAATCRQKAHQARHGTGLAVSRLVGRVKDHEARIAALETKEEG